MAGRQEQAMVGSRVRLEYEDQNESFEIHLPVEGTVSRRCTATTGPDDWYLVELDEPIEYQHEVGPKFHFVRLVVPKVLIRSRWEGVPISPTTSPSVFLVLVHEDQTLPDKSVVIEDLIHVCWARCTVAAASQLALDDQGK
jgi:hypothetical protein